MAKRKPSEDLNEYSAPKVMETKPAVETYSGKNFIGQKFDNTVFAETELAFADFKNATFTDCKFYCKSIHNCNFMNAKFFKTVEKSVTDPKTKTVIITKEVVIDNPMKDCEKVSCYTPGCNVAINKNKMVW